MNQKKKRNLNGKQFQNNRRPNNFKGKGNLRSGDYMDESARRTKETMKGSDSKPGRAYLNDGSWYIRNEQILKDVARIPYNIPVGLPLFNGGSLFPQNGDVQFSIPGIAMMNVVPMYGMARNPSDPVNVAFAGMFTYIRAHTTSKFDWDDNTLGINMLATDSLYYMVKWAIRLYCTLPLYHQSNKYLPRTLIEAQGVDYDDLMANSAQFRTELNTRLATINALKIPSDLYIFNRHIAMFENYYIEGPSTKDQIYFYKPAAYYIHTKDANGISYLKCHRTLAGGTGTGGRLTASDIIRKLDAMLDPIFNDQYFNLISGYIEQAYEGRVMRIDYVPDMAVLPLVYSEEVLMQFKNAKTHAVKHATSGSGYADNTFDLIQDPASATDIRVCLKTVLSTNALRVYRLLNTDTAVDIDNTSTDKLKWNFAAVENEYTRPFLITSPNADVSEMENVINTRLIPVLSWVPAATGLPDITADDKEVGTEWPISVEVITRYLDPSDEQIKVWHYELHTSNLYDATLSNAYNVLSTLLPIISVFKYFPEIRVSARYGASDQNVSPARVSNFEVDNYALLRHKDAILLHRACILGMLRVPENASTNLAGK